MPSQGSNNNEVETYAFQNLAHVLSLHNLQQRDRSFPMVSFNNIVVMIDQPNNFSMDVVL